MQAVELISRLCLATGVGLLIGFEREARGHQPGLRTHALVALGAALFSVAGAYGFSDTGSSAEPTRIAAQVATGIGFIGAGAVMQSHASVRGLTTAATLWLSAGVGVAAAAGLYLAVIAATLLGMIVLVVLRLAKPRLLGRFGGVRRLVSFEYRPGHGTLGPVLRTLEHCGCGIDEIDIVDDDAIDPRVGLRQVRIQVRIRDESQLRAGLATLETRSEVVRIALTPSTFHDQW